MPQQKVYREDLRANFQNYDQPHDILVFFAPLRLGVMFLAAKEDNSRKGAKAQRNGEGSLVTHFMLSDGARK
ncbi:MAG TPA: hypothetical protein VF634_05790 [Pyrinomonadaceae bacterium]|jgi:hypothetical protein